nr:phage replisome organizer N-terminal domain-containing protein [Clostridium saccharobutylicum]
MRERKYVKFRVDMYDDTKFKIIDRRPERDIIHYVWNRIVVLAGKVNLEGELYLSKNIPYTVETLSIEFNRDIEEVKLALDVLMELEMVELTEHNIYIVKNFAKHQNIKAKGKNKSEDKEVKIKKPETKISEKVKDEINDNKINEPQDKISEDKIESIVDNESCNMQINHKEISKADIHIDDKNMSNENTDSNPQDDIPILLEMKKSKKAGKKKNEDNSIESMDEETADDSIFCITEGEIPLNEGEQIITQWSFGG